MQGEEIKMNSKDLGEGISSGHKTILSIIGYLQLGSVISIIVFAFLRNWSYMNYAIISLICLLIFTYRYYRNILINMEIEE